MKQFQIILFTLIIVSVETFAQNPSWKWAKTAGGPNSDISRSTAIDSEGNIYQLGYFKNTLITFGTVILQNTNPGFDDIFISKYNPNGNVIWSKTITGKNDDKAYAICLDHAGNLYIAGSFNSDTLFLDNLSLVNKGFNDMFIAKLDKNGQGIWMRNENGLSNEYAYSVSADDSGRVVLTGNYDASIWILGSDTLHNSGFEDVFVLKYDSLGNILWAKSFGGENYDNPTSITTDNEQNVIITGSFLSSSLTVGSLSINNQGVTNSDIFIIKYNHQGNLLWCKGIGGSNNDVANSVITNSLNDIIIGGYFYSSTLLVGNDSLNNSGKSDMLLAKFLPSGNPLWARKIGGAEMDEIYSVVHDKQQNIIAGGIFASPKLIIEDDTVTNNGSHDILIARYDFNGHPHSAQSVGNSKDDILLSIACDTNNQIVVTGYYFSLILTFGSNTIFNSSSSFFPEAYIAKLDSIAFVPSGIFSLHSANQVSIYPNPASSIVQLDFSMKHTSDLEIEIYTIEGKKCVHKKINHLASGKNNLSIDVNQLLQGMYVIHLKTDKEHWIGKLQVLK